MYDIIFSRAIDHEVTDAYLYYEEQQSGLGERFLDELDTCFHTIRAYPEHFQFKRKPFREFVAPKFPFVIIYEFDGDKIIVFSVFNTHKNPRRKP